jgi:RNA polymerase sigma-70 factor (ECF subfamily)
MARRSDSVDDGPGIAETLPATGDDPPAAMARREREDTVREALFELPETLRSAIVLHDYEGLGHEEIARRAGIAHTAARKRYSRALAALAKKLEGRI